MTLHSFSQLVAALAAGFAGIGLGVIVMLVCFYYTFEHDYDDDTLELSDDGPLADET